MKDALEEKSLDLETANELCKRLQNRVSNAERNLRGPKVPILEDGDPKAQNVAHFVIF